MHSVNVSNFEGFDIDSMSKAVVANFQKIRKLNDDLNITVGTVTISFDINITHNQEGDNVRID